MKKLNHLILFISLTLVFTISMGYSFAQSSSIQNQGFFDKEIFIFVQTVVENQDGQLVTYLTSDKFTFIDSDGLNDLLDSEATEKDEIITIDEKKYQVIKRKKTLSNEIDNVIASTLIGHKINGNLEIVARFAHDGYPIENGDTVITVWTFIRPME